MPGLFSNEPPAPLRAWDYVRLRRLAAGRTIEQAARPYWTRPEHQADCERNWAMIETPGVTIPDHHARDLGRGFPIDPDVYMTLRDCPPEQHPTVCRGCGCTPWDPAVKRDGSEATIGDDLVCSACVEKRARTRDQAMRRAA